MTTRRIAILTPGDVEHSGGIGRAIGYVVDAWKRSSDGPTLAWLDTRGPAHIALAPVYFAKALWRLWRMQRRGELALLHVNLSSRGSTARKFVICTLARAIGAPYLIHLHGSRFDRFYRGLPKPAQRAVRRMFAGAARTVVLGERWKRFVVSEIGVDPAKVTIVYNGVPAPALARKAAVPGEPCHVLFLGRLGARKGTPELVAALAAPALAALPWRATLAGDGEIESFRAMAAEKGIAERVAFPGWVDRSGVDRLLAEADILVLPSHEEGLPVAVIEALANEIAVVTTPVGALPEVLSDGETALLVEPGDAVALAVALQRLVADPALRTRIGTAGAEVYRKNFRIEDVAMSIRAIYDRVLAGSVALDPALAAESVAPGPEQRSQPRILPQPLPAKLAR
ncbi:MAG TPA: glycosyltransferase family 4 protein [Stellaceae bacterium]|nr:glycosyltransferase family 4 protein [Stellaceae bacterium]